MVDIISRQSAVKLGYKKYFTGIPCKNKHIAERMISSFKDKCVECYKNQMRRFRLKHKERWKDLDSNGDTTWGKRKIYVSCLNCKKSLTKFKSAIKNGRGNFCSKICQGAYKSNKYKKIILCEFCHKEFIVTISSKRRFCCNSCASQSNAPIQRKYVKKAPVEKQCKYCQRKYLFKVGKYKEHQGKKFCSIDCKIKAQLGKWAGKNNPNFIDGREGKSKHYRGENWKEIRKNIYRRDNYKCQECGKKCRKDINCHHIIPYYETQNNLPENLITLCASCHSKIEKNYYGTSKYEEYKLKWSTYIKGIAWKY